MGEAKRKKEAGLYPAIDVANAAINDTSPDAISIVIGRDGAAIPLRAAHHELNLMDVNVHVCSDMEFKRFGFDKGVKKPPPVDWELAWIHIDFPYYEKPQILCIDAEHCESALYHLYLIGWSLHVPMTVFNFGRFELPAAAARIELSRSIAKHEEVYGEDAEPPHLDPNDLGPLEHFYEFFMFQGMLNAAYRRDPTDTRAFKANLAVASPEQIKKFKEMKHPKLYKSGRE